MRPPHTALSQRSASRPPSGAEYERADRRRVDDTRPPRSSDRGGKTNVHYLEPLRRAWDDTKRILFRPFDPGKWLVIAFAAWLAGLASGGSGGGGPRWHGNRADFRDVGRAVRGAWDWVHQHIILSPTLIALVLLATGVILLLIWISSRGKLVFLHNVVQDRAAIFEPWSRLGRLGDSLFAWRLGFFAVAVLSVATVLVTAMAIGGGVHRADIIPPLGIAATAMVVVGGLVVGLGIAYVNLFLESFVVPLMYRDKVTATEAWRRFAPMFEQHTGALLLYGLFVLGYWLAVAAAVVTAGLLTCCIGLVVIALPYVGTVILLPALVTYRAFSLEFLSQFEPGFSLFSRPAPPPGAPPAAAG